MTRIQFNTGKNTINNYQQYFPETGQANNLKYPVKADDTQLPTVFLNAQKGLKKHFRAQGVASFTAYFKRIIPIGPFLQSRLFISI